MVSRGAHLTLRGLTLRDGRADPTGFGLVGGGAVWTLGGLTADRVDFLGNRADENGGAIWAFGPGAQLVVTRSRFVDNVVACSTSAVGGGGAISIQGTQGALVKDSTFVDNVAVGAGTGGAIAALPNLIGVRQYEPLTVTGSRFEGNAAVGTGEFFLNNTMVGGGAVSVIDRGLHVVKSRFTGNLARTSGFMVGGAISATSSPKGMLTPPSPFTVVDSRFEANRVTLTATFAPFGLGGAIGILGNYQEPRVAASEFRGNSAPFGGAIWTGPDMTIHRTKSHRTPPRALQPGPATGRSSQAAGRRSATRSSPTTLQPPVRWGAATTEPLAASSTAGTTSRRAARAASERRRRAPGSGRSPDAKDLARRAGGGRSFVNSIALEPRDLFGTFLVSS